MRYLKAVMMALVLMGSTTSCRGSAPIEEDDPTADNKVHLLVKNETINEMDIYAVCFGGSATRLGSVSGLVTKEFSLDRQYFQGTTLTIVGSPIAGSGRATTGPLSVGAGQTIDFIIRTTLRASTVSIH